MVLKENGQQCDSKSSEIKDDGHVDARDLSLPWTNKLTKLIKLTKLTKLIKLIKGSNGWGKSKIDKNGQKQAKHTNNDNFDRAMIPS